MLWNTKRNVLRYTTCMYFLIVPSSLNVTPYVPNMWCVRITQVTFKVRNFATPAAVITGFLYFSLTFILWNTKHNVLRYTTRMYFLIVPSSLNSKAHLAGSSWWERTWWSKSSGICGTVSLGGWFRTLRRIVVPRGGFTVKLTKLKLQGPSIAWASSRALGGTLNKLFTFEPSCMFVILYSFSWREPQELYKLQASQNLALSLVVSSSFKGEEVWSKSFLSCWLLDD